MTCVAESRRNQVTQLLHNNLTILNPYCHNTAKDSTTAQPPSIYNLIPPHHHRPTVCTITQYYWLQPLSCIQVNGKNIFPSITH